MDVPHFSSSANRSVVHALGCQQIENAIRLLGWHSRVPRWVLGYVAVGVLGAQSVFGVYDDVKLGRFDMGGQELLPTNSQALQTSPFLDPGSTPISAGPIPYTPNSKSKAAGFEFAKSRALGKARGRAWT